jgi:hypothetical protein
MTPDFRGGGQKQKRHNWIQLCLKSVFKTTHASICRGEHKKTYAKVKLNFFETCRRQPDFLQIFDRKKRRRIVF